MLSYVYQYYTRHSECLANSITSKRYMHIYFTTHVAWLQLELFQLIAATLAD